MFLVTGLGHSGTGWAARVFRYLGHECGHERWFGPHDSPTMNGSDSSWLAVPHVETVPVGTRVIHLVRDPLSVLRSMLRIRFLNDRRKTSPYTRYALQHCPDLAGDEFSRTVGFIARWDNLVEGRVLRLEDATPDVMTDVVEYATDERPDRNEVAAVMAKLGTNVNAHARRSASDTGVTWDTAAADQYGGEFMRRAGRFGYGPG